MGLCRADRSQSGRENRSPTCRNVSPACPFLYFPATPQGGGRPSHNRRDPPPPCPKDPTPLPLLHTGGLPLHAWGGGGE